MNLRKLQQNFWISKAQRLRLYTAIYELPRGTDIKKLQNHNLYRLRVGDYRIIYSIDDVIKIITIETIDNCGDVYKKSLN